ncbi:FAD-dependent oxidoreductase [Myxococcota bacterium]|nr:FAD-dependent oxidoreductase [Myxococcota bacterium]
MSAAPRHLLAPGRIGGMTTKNRIVVTAMGVSFAEEDGSASDRLVAYHERHAEGGAGLIVVGVTGVAHPVGAVIPNQTSLSQDRFIPGMRRIAEVAHRHGAKAAVQLHHGGVVAGYSTRLGQPLWTPSILKLPSGDFGTLFFPEELASFMGGEKPTLKVMTEEDIAVVVGQFAAAARRAQEAGIDAVELHGGHGYLIDAFLSPSSNGRTDGYGGSLAGRARLYLEILAAVRKTVGPDFPIICKLNAREVGKHDGVTFDIAVETARLLERAGADAITASAYHDVGVGKLHSESNIPHVPNTNVPGAATVKRAVSIPVIASGRIEFDDADRSIAEKACDYVAFGRKILADPAFPKKLAAGRAQDVRPCIYCYTCVSEIYLRKRGRCAVNPETGSEHVENARLSAPRRRVVVVGSGAAGLEAARRLDERGHEVVLLEKDERLGGTLRVASLPYEPNNRLLDWLTAEVEKSRIDVRLSTQATPDTIRDLAPDVVVVATGAVRSLPEIPGKEQPIVFSGDDLRALLSGRMTEDLKRKTSWLDRVSSKVGAATGLSGSPEMLRTATRAYMPLGKQIVILGGELVGLELAEFLTERGRQVTVVDDEPMLGAGLTVVRRMRLIAELREHAVALFPGSSQIQIESDGVLFVDAEGRRQRIAADQVIVAKGTHEDRALAESLRTAGFTVVEAGDGLEVKYIEGAIRGAWDAVEFVETK